MRIGVVAAEFNGSITDRMLMVAKEKAALMGASVVRVCRVPGTFDMPVVADALLGRNDVDAVVTLGAVIRGQTKHDEVIAHSTAQELARLSVKHRKPVSLGITGPGMTERQAYARIRPVAERAVEAVFGVRAALEEAAR